jgi:hypothetical protein
MFDIEPSARVRLKILNIFKMFNILNMLNILNGWEIKITHLKAK